MARVSHKLMKQQQYEQQKPVVREDSSAYAIRLTQVRKSRTLSYDSLFGSSSNETDIANDSHKDSEAELCQRALSIDDTALTQNINANFAALHAVFGLGTDEEANIGATIPPEVGETSHRDSRRWSTSSISLFGDSE